jgi:hypothetical protein
MAREPWHTTHIDVLSYYDVGKGPFLLFQRKTRKLYDVEIVFVCFSDWRYFVTGDI